MTHSKKIEGEKVQSVIFVHTKDIHSTIIVLVQSHQHSEVMIIYL
jgi:hypothetical protein